MLSALAVLVSARALINLIQFCKVVIRPPRDSGRALLSPIPTVFALTWLRFLRRTSKTQVQEQESFDFVTASSQWCTLREMGVGAARAIRVFAVPCPLRGFVLAAVPVLPCLIKEGLDLDAREFRCI